MRVRILMSSSYPEYRLVMPVAMGIESIAAQVKAVVEQMGDWEERSQDELDESRAEHREVMADIAACGAHLWRVSAAYTGRVEVAPPG